MPTIPGYRIEDSNSDRLTSSAHTTPDTPSYIPNNATSPCCFEPCSNALMDSDECFQILKQELAESRHRSEVMGRALDAILSKLNIDPNELKMEENSTFRKNQHELLRSPRGEFANSTPCLETSTK